MTEQTNKKKLAEILKDLFSTEEVVVLDALSKLRHEGDSSVINPLLRVYKDWEDGEIRNQVQKLMYEIKMESVATELVSALENEEFESIREFIVSIFWNAGIYPVSDLDVLIRTAVQSDYNVVLEVLTVVENMEGPFDENQLSDAIFDVQDEIDESEEGPKLNLLKSLHEVLVNFQNNQ